MDIKYYSNNDISFKSYNGDKFWYQNGRFHRVDCPAIEYSSGTKVWYHNGEVHREDGPAIEYTNGSKFWYRNGNLHRVDGPAVDSTNGDKHWHQMMSSLPKKHLTRGLNNE